MDLDPDVAAAPTRGLRPSALLVFDDVIDDIIERFPDAVALLRAHEAVDGGQPKLEVLYANAEARSSWRNLGAPPGVLSVGLPIEDAAPAIAATDVVEACHRVARTGTPESCSFSCVSPDQSGQIAYDLRILRLRNDILVWVQRDVTARLRAIDDLRNSEREAERANRAKTEFLSRMSHELRTPLNSILGFSQLLELDGLGESHGDSLRQIQRAGRHLLDLINEVLDVARIESGRLDLSFEPVSVEEVAGAARDLIAPTAREQGIVLQPIELPDGPFRVQADRQRLLQVLLNLLSNAVKYNRPNGDVRIICHVSGGTGTISVRDTGPGLSIAERRRLFVPFERLGAEQTGIEGTGVGLALSRGLVERMGGALSVSSEVGAGCTFTVELPEGVESDPSVPDKTELLATPSDAGTAVEGDCTILYIEDNLANVRLVERVLARRPDVHLLTAVQGRLGLDIARQQVPSLILLDLHLPDMHGSEVLRRLREDPALNAVPVVILSADATNASVENLRSQGADDYLTKPFDVVQLLAFVDRARGVPAATHQPAATAADDQPDDTTPERR